MAANVADRPCLVCGGTYGGCRLPGLLQCERCGFVTANLALSRAELETLYSGEYFAGREYKDYVGERPLIEHHFRRRLARLKKNIGETSRRRLFEIGSAYGFFLGVAQAEFAKVAGIDISSEASSYAREQLGLDVASGDFIELPMKEPVDVVCMWDTIEHLVDPDSYVAKASSILKPGGSLAITTGDIGSVVARVRGSRWRQIHPPTHLHYFSRATLTRLLEKHGLRVTYCGYDGMYRSVETMVYIILAIRHGRPRLYDALKRTGLLNWNLYINLFDIIYVIARKDRAEGRGFDTQAGRQG